MSALGEREGALRAALAAEQDWQVLLRHFDFNEGFAFVLILVESAENGALCREALQDYLRERGRGLLRIIATNTTEDVQSLPYLLHKPKGLEGLPAIWIESVIPEGSVSPEEFQEWRKAWRVCFAGLNRVRNTMQRTIPCALVFVTAPWMQELIRNIAPDFWSIRSTVARISPRLAGREPADLAERVFSGPRSDPSLAPDPEFAEREADKLRGKPGQELALARILQRAGQGFLSRAEQKQAIRVLEEAQQLQVEASAPPVDLASTKTFLGRAFKMDGQWRQAETCFRAALELDRSALGEDHPATANDMNDLAGLLRATNRLAEAEPLYRRALAIGEKSYGPDHPTVATDLNNLAGLLQDTNRLAEAEPLYRRALAIDEKSYGPDHPSVARDLNNLAGLLEATNRLAEAEPLFRRALEIDEKSYGPDHPDVATDLNNLAGLLQDTNRLAEAEPLFRRALAIHEKSYGPDHPDVATDLNNLAGLLQATNRLAEAEPLYRRALEIVEAFTAKTGYSHPNLETVRQNYRQCLDELGRKPRKRSRKGT